MKTIVKQLLIFMVMLLMLSPLSVYAQDENTTALKSLSVLLLGIDTGDLGRVEQGRSDVIMVATVNPTTKKVTITSIPRDTYTEIVGKGYMDKINHAYAFGGVEMS